MKKTFLVLILAAFGFTSQAQTADTTLHGTLVSKSPYATTVTYLWTKVSGPASGSISNPTSLVTDIKGLSVGTYVYQLVGTDNFGNASLPKTVKVNVLMPFVTAPVMDAGPDINVKAH